MKLFIYFIFFILTVFGIGIVYFVASFECKKLPIDNIQNSIEGEFEIVGFTQACPTTKPHGEFYLKRKDDKSDGYRKRNLIVESEAGSIVEVKWSESNVIQVTSYREGSVRKISKSVFGNDIRLLTDYGWQDKKK